MPLQICHDLHKVDRESFEYIYEENASIPVRKYQNLVRCNVYRPKYENQNYPVLVTYGPYGKDIHYSAFHAESYSEINPDHKSPHSAWETPDPGFWTKHGYAVVRADEIGLGQSPGLLDTMSAQTAEAFVDVIEWAASQPWSSGKVGLLGISYYAGSQWRVAARKPKGLACIIPWEGMSDYYRDRCRHGGILSDTFIDFWWNRQVITNQYGRPGRASRNWGADTIEGDLDSAELEKNRRDQTIDNATNYFLDDEYYASKKFNLGDIEVPLLSVGNWGGILLHLRGNVEGYMTAGSKQKYLRFVTGRHDLPFYYKRSVKMQMSFLNAFLKGNDPEGWAEGRPPRIGFVLRKGDVGVNDPKAEEAYPHRFENEWPIARTQYQKYYLTSSHGLTLKSSPHEEVRSIISYKAPGSLHNPHFVQFASDLFENETEFTGHVVAHLNVSVIPEANALPPSEIDIFLTLRHLSASGKEVLYTGTVGDPVPITKGWLRTSLRKSDISKSRFWKPYRTYLSTDVQPVVMDEIYEVDVEVWPMNVIMEVGDRLVLEVSSGDTQGAGLFEHNSPVDRPTEKLRGINRIHFGGGRENWLLMPVIPPEVSGIY